MNLALMASFSLRENTQQIAAFAAKYDNFVELVEDCYICLEPLLNNIGTTKFGVVSWKCRCTVPQKAHSRCVFSKICHATNGQGKCDMCNSPMEFEKTTRKGTHAMIRLGISQSGTIADTIAMCVRLMKCRAVHVVPALKNRQFGGRDSNLLFYHHRRARV